MIHKCLFLSFVIKIILNKNDIVEAVNRLDLRVQSELDSTSTHCDLNLRVFLNQQSAFIWNIDVDFVVNIFNTNVL